MRSFLLPLFAIAASSATALASAADDYRCVIDRVEDIGANGAAEIDEMREAYVGKEFTVDRTTGLMVGALKNSFVTKPQVIDRGAPRQNAYKVVTTMKVTEGAGAGSNLYALVIDEYLEGPKKPFIFLENDKAYLGSCIHF